MLIATEDEDIAGEKWNIRCSRTAGWRTVLPGNERRVKGNLHCQQPQHQFLFTTGQSIERPPGGDLGALDLGAIEKAFRIKISIAGQNRHFLFPASPPAMRGSFGL